MTFELPTLPYAYDALEPYVDAKTMEIHHGMHHAGYVSKLNAAIKESGLEVTSLEDLIKNHANNAAIRNNGGGHWNHSLFWEVIAPNGDDKPSGKLADAINAAFGSFDKFKETFSNVAATRFGSGWAWLCKNSDGTVCVCSSANQDNPLMADGECCSDSECCSETPILGLDVWEHAYYLNYQNRRPDYINAFFKLINWNEVSKRFES